jgi:thioredoxin 1
VCIKLHANWCEPCKAIGPKFSNLAQQYSSKCLLVSENVDLKLSLDCGVESIPAFIFYYNGKLIKNEDGSNVGGNIDGVEDFLK